MDFTTDTDFAAHFKAYREYVAVNPEEGLLNFSDFRTGLLGGTVQVVVNPENVIEVPEPVVTEEVTEEVAVAEEVTLPEPVVTEAVTSEKDAAPRWAREMNGKMFGKVLVVRYNYAVSEAKGKTHSDAICPACHSEFTARSYSIKSGSKIHCGCLRKKKSE